ncbi:bifunctional 3-(3-hydroxy-phenyl)propionate/3-hydroxycinnamic acid hydroxylase [Streptomyces mordarskii]|uniref:Bifunctional 3-(3-hydroxy-phenyl)propionate/3-hydroxycinnamic acid hydroxylase n=1 Tax=Streptomyces mordarskii TaxID=1226758 RepID=A0ABN1D742_9ACTN
MTPSANEERRNRVDVAVIGCGPTGLTLARLLEQENLTVAVIDRSWLPMERSRATHLDDETMRTFHQVGAGHLEPTFSPVGTYRHYDADRRIIMEMELNRGLTDQGWQSDYMFHQPDFETVLRGRAYSAATTSTFFGWEVTSMREAEEGVVVDLHEVATHTTQQVTASFVVGCDGAHSYVRAFMGCGQIDYDATHRSLIIDILPFVPNEALATRDMFIQGSIRNPLTFVPIQEPRLRFELMLRPDDVAADFARVEQVYERLGPWFQPGDYRILRCDVYEWRSVTATPWRAGRVLLAGDAAHTMPPHLGQGMCSGIRDAANLARKLGRVVREESPFELLDSYEAERAPHVAAYTTISAQMANAIETMRASDGEVPVVKAEPLRPQIGPGIWDGSSAVGGRLSAQPRVDSETLLDDVVGYRFALVGDPAVVAQTTPQTKKLWEGLNVKIVDGFSEEIRGWVEGLDAAAAVIRPDRYLYGTARTAAELDALAGSLEAALR